MEEDDDDDDDDDDEDLCSSFPLNVSICLPKQYDALPIL